MFFVVVVVVVVLAHIIIHHSVCISPWIPSRNIASYFICCITFLMFGFYQQPLIIASKPRVFGKAERFIFKHKLIHQNLKVGMCFHYCISLEEINFSQNSPFLLLGLLFSSWPGYQLTCFLCNTIPVVPPLLPPPISIFCLFSLAVPSPMPVPIPISPSFHTLFSQSPSPSPLVFTPYSHSPHLHLP